MVYHNPHITGEYNPLYTLNNQGFFSMLTLQISHCGDREIETNPTIMVKSQSTSTHAGVQQTPFLGHEKNGLASGTAAVISTVCQQLK